MNHTFIVLLAKVDHPTKIEQYRSISLCNVAYKVISKILSNRLKRVISKLISPFHAAFVPGRAIQENIFLCHEILHSIKVKRGRKGLAALKLDMEKAYDRMDWSFILHVQKRFGFCDQWIGWIHQCLSIVSYSVLLNGSAHGLFKPSRGLRQGDPLSPFLLILGSEVLSRMLLAAEGRGAIHGIKVNRSALSISHLLFADDLMIFSQANRQKAFVIGDILSTYSTWSGQRVSFEKSALYCSENSNPHLVRALCDLLQVKSMASNNKYLGLPLFFGKSRKKIV